MDLSLQGGVPGGGHHCHCVCTNLFVHVYQYHQLGLCYDPEKMLQVQCRSGHIQCLQAPSQYRQRTDHCPQSRYPWTTIRACKQDRFQKLGSHGQGLLITLAPRIRGFHTWNHFLYHTPSVNRINSPLWNCAIAFKHKNSYQNRLGQKRLNSE